MQHGLALETGFVFGAATIINLGKVSNSLHVLLLSLSWIANSTLSNDVRVLVNFCTLTIPEESSALMTSLLM